MSEQKVVATEVQAFIDAFRIIGNGEIAKDTASKLQECIKGTMIHNKKSSLTIKLEIEQTADDSIVVMGQVTSKVPQPKIRTSFFVNDRTFLPTRNRPEQQTLPMGDE